jgi:hypothetical protein
MEVTWDPVDLSSSYGYLYEVSNNGTTVAKVKNNDVVTCMREVGVRQDGVHNIHIKIDSISNSSTESCDIIGICSHLYNWGSNCVNGTYSVGIRMDGRFILQGKTEDFAKPLMPGDVIKFQVDCGGKKVRISVGDLAHECSLPFEPPYKLGLSFRKTGAKVTASVPKERAINPSENSQYSRIAASVGIDGGNYELKKNPSMGGVFVHFPKLGSLYDAYMPSSVEKYDIYTENPLFPLSVLAGGTADVLLGVIASPKRDAVDESLTLQG